jgi:hypothetical protein
MNNRILKSARLGMAGAAFAAVFGGLLSLGAVALQSSPAAAATPTGSAYVPLSTPTRIADTRANSGLPNAGQTLGAGATDVVTLPTTGVGAVPTGATAVVLNVTEADATAASYFTVYPTGDTKPAFSNLNFVPGNSQPNLVTSPIGTGNTISIYNFAGSADAVVDLEGYYVNPPPATTSGQFFPLTPARITDTRTNSGFPNAGKTLSSNSVLSVQVTGAGGVPATGVYAVELNVTATDTTANSFFTVYPAGPALPVVSNLNWLAGATIPNRVIVPVNQTTGAIDIYNLAGEADAVVDVDGWFSNATSVATGGSYFNPVASPARITDTRAGSGSPNAGDTLSPTGTLTVQVTGAGGVPALSPAVAVTGAVLNVTEATATQPSYLTVFPASATRPTASDLNFSAGQVIANADQVGLSSTGTIDIYNFQGATDVVVDVMGYYVPVIAPVTNTVTVTPTPGSIVADGSSTSAIAVVVTNPTPAPVAGDIVTLSVAPAATCGTLSATAPDTVTGNVVTGVTDATGTVNATYTSSVFDAVCTFTAVEADTAQSGTAPVSQTGAGATTYEMSVAAVPSTVAAGGTAALDIAVSEDGAPVPSDAITFTTNGATQCGSAPTGVTTASNGEAVASYTASTDATSGPCVVHAHEAAGGKTVATTITS